MVSPNTVVGGGLNAISHNLGANVGSGMANVISDQNARENTGLWIDVKDIDHPRWFIKFKISRAGDKAGEATLRQWMEIMSQTINLDAPVGTI
jgi:uncharacterized protein YhdP